jgi:hypothetical protein
MLALTRGRPAPAQRHGVYYDTPKPPAAPRRSIRLRRRHPLAATLKLEAAPSAGFSARAEWEFGRRGGSTPPASRAKEILAATGLDWRRGCRAGCGRSSRARFARRSARS